MSVEISWHAIALRLIVTILAGTLLGINRSRRGHEAGLRTTLLVTLAASIAMIQMNLLLSTNGKPHDSFAVMDMMRLPLGILTGVGFIGAGAIIKKDEMVIGVTTAATMWFSTVIGLCIGGGQIILGSVSAIIGFLILSVFRQMENSMKQKQRATLTITVTERGLSENDLRAMLRSAQIHVHSVAVRHLPSADRKRYECDVRWPANREKLENPAVLNDLSKLPELIEIDWEPAGVLPA